MKKEEIGGIINDRFKNINKFFHKAIDNFEAKDIRGFRNETRKLKVFLHLVSMESKDGLSYRITKRMKTIYGYLGIILNFQLQLKKTNEYVKKSSKVIPVYYMNLLERKLENWKKLSKDFIGPDYDFLNDKYEIMVTLPDSLTVKSIKNFINYTFYEIRAMSGRQDEEALNNVRKFMEDIYYNLPFIKPYLTTQLSGLFDEKEMSECLRLLGDFRDKCTVVELLQNFNIEALDEYTKQLLKQMENDWLREKKEMKVQLAAKMDAMHITENHLNELSLQE